MLAYLTHESDISRQNRCEEQLAFFLIDHESSQSSSLRVVGEGAPHILTAEAKELEAPAPSYHLYTLATSPHPVRSFLLTCHEAGATVGDYTSLLVSYNAWTRLFSHFTLI